MEHVLPLPVNEHSAAVDLHPLTDNATPSQLATPTTGTPGALQLHLVWPMQLRQQDRMLLLKLPHSPVEPKTSLSRELPMSIDFNFSDLINPANTNNYRIR